MAGDVLQDLVDQLAVLWRHGTGGQSGRIHGAACRPSERRLTWRGGRGAGLLIGRRGGRRGRGRRGQQVWGQNTLVVQQQLSCRLNVSSRQPEGHFSRGPLEPQVQQLEDRGQTVRWLGDSSWRTGQTGDISWTEGRYLLHLLRTDCVQLGRLGRVQQDLGTDRERSGVHRAWVLSRGPASRVRVGSGSGTDRGRLVHVPLGAVQRSGRVRPGEAQLHQPGDVLHPRPPPLALLLLLVLTLLDRRGPGQNQVRTTEDPFSRYRIRTLPGAGC